jgi:hypothetical protein
MLNPAPSDYRSSLADRLRREALASRPEFSAELHARLCRAIEKHQAESVAIEPRPARVGPATRWAVAALAACCLLAAAVVVWQTAARPGGGSGQEPGELAGVKEPASQPNMPDTVAIAATVDPLAGLEDMTDAAGRAADELGSLVDSAVATQRWAYLDHDARQAMETLAARLPFDVSLALLPDSAAERPETP